MRAVLRSKVLSRPRIRRSFIFKFSRGFLQFTGAMILPGSLASRAKANRSSSGASANRALKYPALVSSPAHSAQESDISAPKSTRHSPFLVARDDLSWIALVREVLNKPMKWGGQIHRGHRTHNLRNNREASW